jgi:hypothetical protein
MEFYDFPASKMDFIDFMEMMLPHCRPFLKACPKTRDLDPELVLQRFMVHMITVSTYQAAQEERPNWKHYGHKGKIRPYPFWFIKCLCQFEKQSTEAPRPFRGAAPASCRSREPQPMNANPSALVPTPVTPMGPARAPRDSSSLNPFKGDDAARENSPKSSSLTIDEIMVDLGPCDPEPPGPIIWEVSM